MGPLIFNVQPRNFYPRSPCGERHIICQRIDIRVNISIHALLAESDVFLTLTVRNVPIISIHALLAESDQAANGLAHAPPQISIHALLAESDSFKGN